MNYIFRMWLCHWVLKLRYYPFENRISNCINIRTAIRICGCDSGCYFSGKYALYLRLWFCLYFSGKYALYLRLWFCLYFLGKYALYLRLWFCLYFSGKYAGQQGYSRFRLWGWLTHYIAGQLPQLTSKFQNSTLITMFIVKPWVKFPNGNAAWPITSFCKLYNGPKVLSLLTSFSAVKAVHSWFHLLKLVTALKSWPNFSLKIWTKLQWLVWYGKILCSSWATYMTSALLGKLEKGKGNTN